MQILALHFPTLPSPAPVSFVNPTHDYRQLEKSPVRIVIVAQPCIVYLFWQSGYPQSFFLGGESYLTNESFTLGINLTREVHGTGWRSRVDLRVSQYIPVTSRISFRQTYAGSTYAAHLTPNSGLDSAGLGSLRALSAESAFMLRVFIPRSWLRGIGVGPSSFNGSTLNARSPESRPASSLLCSFLSEHFHWSP